MHRRRLRRPVLTVVALPLLALGLAGCSSDNDVDSLSPGYMLQKDDPMGFVACRDVVLAEDVEGDERERLLEAVAAAAASAESRSIRATVDPPVDNAESERVGPSQRGRWTVDPDALREGCLEAGFAIEDAADNA